MAIRTAIATLARLVRIVDVGSFNIGLKPVMPATVITDSQVILTFPCAARVLLAHLRVPNNLGAGATLKLQKRAVADGTAVDISASTTAATAGVVSSAGLLPIDVLPGDTIEVLVSGAGVTTAATIEVDIQAQRA